MCPSHRWDRARGRRDQLPLEYSAERPYPLSEQHRISPPAVLYQTRCCGAVKLDNRRTTDDNGSFSDQSRAQCELPSQVCLNTSPDKNGLSERPGAFPPLSIPPIQADRRNLGQLRPLDPTRASCPGPHHASNAGPGRAASSREGAQRTFVARRRATDLVGPVRSPGLAMCHARPWLVLHGLVSIPATSITPCPTLCGGLRWRPHPRRRHR